MALQAGDRVGGWRLLSELGGGGQGRVWLAEGADGTRVALKVLRAERAGDETARRRFLREMRAALGVSHPRLLRAYDAGEDGKTLWLASEPADGGSLRVRLAEGPLPPPEALALAIGILEALAAVHAAGLLHRDVKPSNILAVAGAWKLADLGLVRSTGEDRSSCTAPGQAVGSPAYLPPEQARGELELDGRADLYSLGCVLWHCLTGAPPYGGAKAHQIIEQHLQAPVPELAEALPGAPAPLTQALRQLLAKHPSGRPRDAAAAIALLRQAGAGLAERLVAAVPAGSAADGPTVTSVSPTMAIAALPRARLRLPDGSWLRLVAGARLRVGRSSEAEVAAAELLPAAEAKRISALHLELTSASAGATATDLGSTHGSRLAGAPLPAREARPLAAGDTLELAGTSALRMALATGPGAPAVLLAGPAGSALLLPARAGLAWRDGLAWGEELRLAVEHGGLWWRRGEAAWAPLAAEQDWR